ncbi:MAG: CoA transferase [Proteobacteria bacterium]|nr:CoA transferase [Pseudomonadota bacterium]
MSALLHGIRVLDFGRYIAGPYCAALLAEYGAEVIRVEKREGSEDRFVAPIGSGGEGSLFLQMNRNKLSLTVDPMTGEGREIVRRLVRTADVVVANLPEQSLAAMGLDYASLSALRPDIIATTSNAFGATGPMAKNVGFDGVGQAMSGAVFMTGEPGQPYRAQVNWVDFGTALHCAFGTMAALMERSRSGKGQHVKGSLLGTALTFMNSYLIEQAVTAINRVPTGNRGQAAAPVNIYRTTDGWVLCQVVGQPLYERWARLMGEPHWLADPRFASDLSRGENAAIIDARMNRWCEGRTTNEAVEILGAAKIPCGPVLNAQGALDHPQVQALGLFQPLGYPGIPSPAPVGRVPLSMSVTQGEIRHRAPLLGEHTGRILGELGYDAASVAGLRERGII